MKIKFYGVLKLVLNVSELNIEDMKGYNLSFVLSKVGDSLNKKISVKKSLVNGNSTIEITDFVDNVKVRSLYNVKILVDKKMIGSDFLIKGELVEIFPLMGGG